MFHELIPANTCVLNTSLETFSINLEICNVLPFLIVSLFSHIILSNQIKLLFWNLNS